MAATTMSALASRCVARQRRCAMALPRRALTSTVHAQQSKGEGEENKSLQAQPPQQRQRSLAPRGDLGTLPSLGRMNQASRGPYEPASDHTPGNWTPVVAPAPACAATRPQ